MRVGDLYATSSKAFMQVSAICPECGRSAILSPCGIPDATFLRPDDEREPEAVLLEDHPMDDEIVVCVRLCPARTCRKVIVLFLGPGMDILESHPPLRIPFDRSEVPEGIAKSFKEAIECHAVGCYTASAIMVRRTLEELCASNGGVGRDLQAKIDSMLKAKAILPSEFTEAFHTLRLLGNDAAHLELKHFPEIGPRESEAAIEVTKLILHAMYQYRTVIKKLTELKSPTGGQESQDAP